MYLDMDKQVGMLMEKYKGNNILNKTKKELDKPMKRKKSLIC